MSLKFKKQEPIEFGDFEATPRLTASKRLRLQEAAWGTVEETEKSIELIASAFGTEAEKVADFIKNEMSPIDCQALQVYLLGGDPALETFQNLVKKQFTKAMGEEEK